MEDDEIIANFSTQKANIQLVFYYTLIPISLYRYTLLNENKILLYKVY